MWPRKPVLNQEATFPYGDRQNQGKIKAAISYEFTEGADDLEPQAGSSRSGGPPPKSSSWLVW